VKPYYEQSDATIYLGDCRDIMPSLRADSVIADPPYNVRAEDIALSGRSAMKRDFGEWDENWRPEPFLELSASIVPNGGTLLAFTSDRLLSAYRECAAWKPRGTIVWEKTNPAPHPRPAYVQATEWIVWLAKDGAAAVWNGNGYTINILRYAACGGNEREAHPTQKPEMLLVELVARHTAYGSIVLDPFMGTGTTLVAARRLGRKAIGVEINERYCEIAAVRLQQDTLSFNDERADCESDQPLPF
jgi:site-specific DNA-methyltransferase (adenine-specific)